MRLIVLAIAAAAALAASGCGEPPPQPVAAPEQAAVAAIAEAPRYVGLWAATEEMCEDPAWRFEARAITTQGEVHCDFEDVAETADGYEAQSLCYAEAPAAPYSLRITLAEEGQAMSVEGGPWAAPTTLVYCGPLPE